MDHEYQEIRERLIHLELNQKNLVASIDKLQSTVERLEKQSMLVRSVGLVVLTLGSVAAYFSNVWNTFFK